MRPTVIIQYEKGDPIPNYFVVGDCQVFIVDENAPHDRVYEWLPRAAEADIARLIPDGSEVGSCEDTRHEAIKSRILADAEGRPRMTVVPDPA